MYQQLIHETAKMICKGIAINCVCECVKIQYQKVLFLPALVLYYLYSFVITCIELQ